MANLERCEDCGKLSISGDTVTIATEEYEELNRYAQIGRARKTVSSYRAVSRSAIALNPALADFILDASVTSTTSEVFKLAKARFGEAVPSRSSIYRFIELMRPHERK